MQGELTMKRQTLLLAAGLIILAGATTTLTAQAQTRHGAAIYDSVQDPFAVDGWTRNGTAPNGDYSTFPEGSPAYHGSNGS
jgi:hypothetical protein